MTSNPATIVSSVPLMLPSEFQGHTAIAACTEDHVFIAANQLMADFYGMLARDLLGKSVFDFYPKFKSSVFYAGAQETISTGKETARVGYSSNTKRWLLVRTFMAGPYPVLSAEPMTDDPKIITDELMSAKTSLKNVFALDADLDAIIDQKSQFGLVLFQVKCLTTMLNQYSNQMVDRCLMQIAARIRTNTSVSNQVYHIDEDLFAMIVPMPFGVGSINLEIHRAISAVKEPFEINGSTLNATMNYGLAIRKKQMTSSDLLQEAKDSLMLNSTLA